MGWEEHSRNSEGNGKVGNGEVRGGRRGVEGSGMKMWEMTRWGEWRGGGTRVGIGNMNGMFEVLSSIGKTMSVGVLQCVWMVSVQRDRNNDYEWH
jgi:hypothetical protein